VLNEIHINSKMLGQNIMSVCWNLRENMQM